MNGTNFMNPMAVNSLPQYSQFNRFPTIQNNGIIWVQGIEGAKAYQLMPNSNAILMDSDNDGVFYIKVSDSVGMCNLRVFNYSEVTTQTTASSNIDMSKYVTREELQDIIKQLGGIKDGKSTISTNAPAVSGTKPLITE